MDLRASSILPSLPPSLFILSLFYFFQFSTLINSSPLHQHHIHHIPSLLSINYSLMDSSNDNQHSQSRSTTPPSQSDINRTSSALGSSTFIGKHRLAAIISQQNQQIQIIQEELDQLETLGESSLVCEQLISSVESSTDALLPVTRGPADAGWDRWFQRANHSSSRNRKRWI